MPAPSETIWPIEPHTQAKHEILRRYLGAWFPILNKYHGRIVYMDGFAGPGEYEGGEPGSPIIALDVAAHHRKQMGGEVVFWFVDEREDRIDHLKQLVYRRAMPKNFVLEIVHGKFHEVLARELQELETKGAVIAPTFAFIDPFGFSGVPMHLVQRLLRHPKTEAFITFQTSSINRFLEHPDPQINAHMIELFGTEEVLGIATGGGDRIAKLRSLYQKQLHQAATYVRYFHMRDRQNAPIYDLFFAGNHELGHYRMKEAMWRVDPDGEFSFSDATDPVQPVLFTLDHSPSLLNAMCAVFERKVDMPVSQIRGWVRNETAFLDNHMNAALNLGEQEKRVLINPIKRDGKRRIKGTFPDEVLVSFR